jgi:tetratricopeptide (TPR) repeat protein
VVCVAALFASQTRDRCLEWQTGIALFEAEARVAPDAGDTWRLLVSAYSRAERSAEAVAGCDAHLSRHPSQFQLAINCGNAYDRAGRAADAERAFRLAATDAHGAVARHNLGHLLLRLGRRTEAEVEYRLSAEQERDPARRHYRRGIWLVQFFPDRRAEAQREFEAAIAIQPRYQPALRMLRELGVR